MTASILGMKAKLGIDVNNTDLDTDLTNALNIAIDITSNDLSKLPSSVSQTNKDHLVEFYACFIYATLSRSDEEYKNKFLRMYSHLYKKLYGKMNL